MKRKMWSGPAAKHSPRGVGVSKQIVRKAARGWAERLEQRVLLSGATASTSLIDAPPVHDLFLTHAISSKSAAANPLTAALSFLKANAGALILTASDFSNAVVSALHTDKKSGVTEIKLTEQANGLAVANSNLSLSLTASGGISIASGFVHVAADSHVKPALNAAAALARVAPSLGLKLKSPPAFSKGNGASWQAMLLSTQASSDPIPATLEYLATVSGVKLAWRMVLRTPGSARRYQIDIDATTGASLGTTELSNQASAALAASSPAPAAPDLAAVSDSGISSTDNITNINNNSATNELQFVISNTTPGATITLYANGVGIGSAIATDTATAVTTNGVSKLTDGVFTFTATQTLPGQAESSQSAGLPVTTDTTPPAAPPAPTLDSSSDSGFSNSDGITDQRSFTVDLSGGSYFNIWLFGRIRG